MFSIQVRRTDKIGTEASFHSIEEYMKHVQSWYETYHLKLRKEKVDMKSNLFRKSVYVATDDPTVLQEAKTK